MVFNLKDCPTYLMENQIILSGKNGSPILEADTITRGMADKDIFEGDLIYKEKEFLGYVIYNNGFFMQKKFSSHKKEIPSSHIYVKRGNRESIKIIQTFERNPILFKHNETIFSFIDLVNSKGNTLNVLHRKKFRRVITQAVTELIAVSGTTSIFEGDLFNGKFITLDNVTSII